MELNRIQRQLERIYEIRAPHPVESFLVTDPEVADGLHPTTSAGAREERLIVAQRGEDVDVSLFVHRDVIERLVDDSPSRELHEGNLPDFLTALEGVSHFVYLTWNAHHQRSISLLELEMQAEVDKWIASALLLGAQRRGRVPARLRRVLFEDARVEDGLAEDLATRYRDASFYAGKYCSGLEKRFLRSGAQPGLPGLLSELRRFYRMGSRAKMHRIERAHRAH